MVKTGINAVLRSVTFGFMLVVFAAVTASSLSAYDLYDYIKAPDDSFSWKKTEETKQPLGDTITFEMTSQTWQGIAWKHKIDLFIPSQCDYPDTGVLIIAGGSAEKQLASVLSGLTKCPVAVLENIPNQPLFNNLREDSLIAYTFAKALETGDMTWPLLLPMTKSAVRAMDVLQEYSRQSMKSKISGFVVGGASKRGWTTYLTAAADPSRVKGIVPIVYDNLNLDKQMDLQIAAYGQYSQEISEYTEINLQAQLKTEKGKQLGKIVDPWTYIDKITMPKLIINGANDPYWNIASMNIYWDKLKGTKAVLYVPNAGHDLGVIENKITAIAYIVSPMTVFIRNVASSRDLPAMSWKYAVKDKQCILNVQTKAKNAVWGKMWIAYSDNRDFRKSKWNPADLKKVKSGFSGSVKLPQSGYMAVFGETRFNDNPSYSLSTQVCVVNSKGVVPVHPAGK